MVCEGWSRGPNGVAEWGRGDDVPVAEVSATWAISDTAWDAHSGTQALTDSPQGLYAGSSNTAAVLAAPLDLTDAAGASLRFFHRWDLRYGFPPSDSASVEVRADGGDWRVLRSYRYVGGAIGSYLYEEIDLSSEVGGTLELRFVVRTSPGNPGDGWVIDDVLVLTEREVLLDHDFEDGTAGWTLEGDWGLTVPLTEIRSVDRDQNPLVFPVSRDVYGQRCASIDPDTGDLVPEPVPVPTPIRAGEGYTWVTASYGGHVDARLVRVGPPTFVPE
jgi:hypothetical protein